VRERNENGYEGYLERQMFQVIGQAGGKASTRRDSPATVRATIDNRQTSTRRQVGR
jgi:hypothetical protein